MNGFHGGDDEVSDINPDKRKKNATRDSVMLSEVTVSRACPNNQGGVSVSGPPAPAPAPPQLFL